jgi:glycosyltransferase involved in cell wall biosynthesis
MNILYLHRHWPTFGGGETVTICLANELIKRGHKIFVAYFNDSEKTLNLPDINPSLKAIKIEGVQYDEFSSEFFVSKGKARIVSSALVKIVRENNIDIIVNQWWPVEFHKNICKKTDAKVIKCLHMDLDTQRSFNFDGLKGRLFNQIYPIYRVIEKKKHFYSADKYLKNCDCFVFLAPSFMEKYQKARPSYNVSKKTDYVYNPLTYPSSISIKNLTEKQNEILFVGRLLEKHKQVTQILKVWERISKIANIDDWKLTIVGSGPDLELYKSIVASKKLSNVYYEGFQNPLPYYQRASIFVMTSAYEGWGMTLVEAQQNGVVPIVMDAYESLHDIITNNQNGLIVPNKNIDAFSKSLIWLMNKQNERIRMAKAGIESAQRFSVENIVDKWEIIFSQLK